MEVFHHNLLESYPFIIAILSQRVAVVSNFFPDEVHHKAISALVP